MHESLSITVSIILMTFHYLAHSYFNRCGTVMVNLNVNVKLTQLLGK